MAVRKNCLLIVFLFITIGLSYGEVLAWSDDGTYVLVTHDVIGEEGGGIFEYQIRGKKSSFFTVSDDMSPGDGSTPQYISDEAYKNIIRQLSEALALHGFSGIQVKYNPDNRYETVVVSSLQQETAKASLVTGKFPVWKVDGLKIKIVRGSVTLSQEGMKKQKFKDVLPVDDGTFWYTVYKNPHFPNILIEYEAEFIGNNYCFIAF